LLEFSKIGKMKYVGHLDLLKLFQRAVNRSGLPVAYSQGFNPHQRLSFALPLPLGAEGLAELVEIEWQKQLPADQIIESLNQQTPAGLTSPHTSDLQSRTTNLPYPKERHGQVPNTTVGCEADRNERNHAGDPSSNPRA
jgi:radical SAM-linked protein